MKRFYESLALLFVGTVFGAIFSEKVLWCLFCVIGYCILWMYTLLFPFYCLFYGQG